MATKAQIEQFISEIAPKAQNAYKNIGKVKPSVCIGMACVECGYGTAGSVKHNSYLGHKVGTGRTATKHWGGKFFTSKTQEEYTVGTHTVINAAFRAYSDMQQCVNNFYELLNTSLYAKVLPESSYADQMVQIKKCGYMTSSTEVNSVLTIIKKYNLTQYDNDLQKPYPVLHFGDRNEYVGILQERLNTNGYDCGKVDNVFGKKTNNALILFKYANEHVEVDEHMWQCLLK